MQVHWHGIESDFEEDGVFMLDEVGIDNGQTSESPLLSLLSLTLTSVSPNPHPHIYTALARGETISLESRGVVHHFNVVDVQPRGVEAGQIFAGYAAELAMPDQLLSSNATINPLLYNWNVAYLSYCDGGSFVGDAVANDTQGALHFRGRAIKEATLAALLAHHQLASASTRRW
jgi:hypothetical protein